VRREGLARFFCSSAGVGGVVRRGITASALAWLSAGPTFHLAPGNRHWTRYLYWPDEFGLTWADYPNVGAWLEQIRALPGWVHAYELISARPSPQGG
jgi:hypothetical protein